MCNISSVYIFIITLLGKIEVKVDVHDSPRRHFRMRANFNIWHDDNRKRSPEGSFYAMYDESDKKTPCEIKGIHFPLFLRVLMYVFMYVYSMSEKQMQICVVYKSIHTLFTVHTEMSSLWGCVCGIMCI